VGLSCLLMHKKPKRKARLEESEIASRAIQVCFVFVCFSLAVILPVRSFTFQLKAIFVFTRISSSKFEETIVDFSLANGKII